jgi:hypothetical protein
VQNRAESQTTRSKALVILALTCAFIAGCKRDRGAAPRPARNTANSIASLSQVAPAPSASAADPIPASDAAAPADAQANTVPLDLEPYAWLRADGAKYPPPVDTLLSRFETPPGYERVALTPGSFGAWLRSLPLAAPGTPVVSFNDEVIHPGDDQYLAAVVAIDPGNIDLQQSPDVVLRLHAEWSWHTHRAKGLHYRASTRLDMPFSRWLKGDRLVAGGNGAFWAPRAKPSQADHDELRAFLDGVFTWANSTSLATQAAKVDPAETLPGDFLIHLRAPGHAVVILDIAHKKTGARLALLGQALNPAQNIHVLRPGRKTAWFSLRPPDPIITPYTKEFAWAGLRRLPEAPPAKQRK